MSNEIYYLTDGTKCPGDKRLHLCPPKKYAPSHIDIAKIAVEMCKIEDVLYPNGRGGSMFRDFLMTCIHERAVTPETCARFDYDLNEG